MSFVILDLTSIKQNIPTTWSNSSVGDMLCTCSHVAEKQTLKIRDHSCGRCGFHVRPETGAMLHKNKTTTKTAKHSRGRVCTCNIRAALELITECKWNKTSQPSSTMTPLLPRISLYGLNASQTLSKKNRNITEPTAAMRNRGVAV